MNCPKCNKTIEDTAKKCPFCGWDTSPAETRCPDCWAKINEGDEVCARCGTNIEEARLAKESVKLPSGGRLRDKIKKISRKKRIAILSVATVLILAVVAVVGYIDYSAHMESVELSRDYIDIADESVDMITELALLYENEVYNKDWIMHIESAHNLREENGDKIDSIKATREPMSYYFEKIKQSGREGIAKAAHQVFYSYTNCYAYVVSEVGKYPHYYDNYEKLLAEFDTAIKELRRLTK